MSFGFFMQMTRVPPRSSEKRGHTIPQKRIGSFAKLWAICQGTQRAQRERGLFLCETFVLRGCLWPSWNEIVWELALQRLTSAASFEDQDPKFLPRISGGLGCCDFTKTTESRGIFSVPNNTIWRHFKANKGQNNTKDWISSLGPSWFLFYSQEKRNWSRADSIFDTSLPTRMLVCLAQIDLSKPELLLQWLATCAVSKCRHQTDTLRLVAPCDTGSTSRKIAA